MALTPAGSIEPGTVARAALALGTAETGRVAPPRPLAEPADPVEPPDPAGLVGVLGEPPELVGAAADPAGLPKVAGRAGALVDPAGGTVEPDTVARPLLAPLTGAALTGAEARPPAAAEPGVAPLGAPLDGAALTGGDADAGAGEAGLVASESAAGAHRAPGAGGGGSSYP